MIAQNITKQIAQAMKSKDELRLSTLRLLSSSLNYERIAKQHELSDDEEIVVVQREIKKRKDAIEAYESVKAVDKANQERKEMEILVEYLPEQLSNEELENIVDKVIVELGASSITDMGKVIGKVMGEVKGKAEGGKVSQIVKMKLTTNG